MKEVMNAGESFAHIRRWADARNIIIGSTPERQALKLGSEMGELFDHVAKKDIAAVKDDIGDCMVVLTIIAAQCNLSVEECLQQAYDDIKDRRGVMYNGVFVKSTDARYPSIIAELGLPA